MCSRWTPSDDFPTLLKLLQLFTFPVSSCGQTSGNSSGIDCTSGFIFRTDSIGLQALPTGIQSRVLDMCSSCYYLTHMLNNVGFFNHVIPTQISCNPVAPRIIFGILSRTHTFNPESCSILLQNPESRANEGNPGSGKTYQRPSTMILLDSCRVLLFQQCATMEKVKQRLCQQDVDINLNYTLTM